MATLGHFNMTFQNSLGVFKTTFGDFDFSEIVWTPTRPKIDQNLTENSGSPTEKNKITHMHIYFQKKRKSFFHRTLMFQSYFHTFTEACVYLNGRYLMVTPSKKSAEYVTRFLNLKRLSDICGEIVRVPCRSYDRQHKMR